MQNQLFLYLMLQGHGTKNDGHDAYNSPQRREIDEMIKEIAEESISLFC